MSDEQPMTYYQIISAMGKEAMWEKKANGETMHLAPLGWKNVKINGKSTIRIDEEKFLLVEEARQLRKQGKSIREICKIMEKKGLRSQRGKVISPMGLWKILKRTGEC